MKTGIISGISRLTPAMVAYCICLIAGSAPAAEAYTENWDAGDANGWLGNTTSSVVVRDGTVGNPAGSLVTRRDLEPPIFDIGATTELPAASGDYTGAAAWMISFDVFYDSGGFTDTWLRFRYQDATFNGWHLDVADAFPAAWQSYSVMFDPTWTDAEASANNWVDETGGTISWQQLMTNVYHPEIRLVLGDELSAAAHIDNFAIKPIPEPATVLLLLPSVFALIGFARRGCLPRSA
jgi:hypothetical protein